MPQQRPQSDSPHLSYSDIFSNRDFLNLGGDDPVARHDAWVQILSSYPEWRNTPRAKQDQMLTDLQRVRLSEEYGTGGGVPPADEILGQQAERVAAKRGPTASGRFILGQGVRGPLGPLVRGVSGYATAPIVIGESIKEHGLLSTGTTLAKEFVAQPYREAMAHPQPGEDADTYVKPNIGGRLINTLSSILGGDPAAARESYRSGDISGAYSEIITMPLLNALAGRSLKSIQKPVSSTRREISSLQTLSRGAVQGRGPVDAAARVAEMQRVLKQVMAKEGITDDMLRREFPTAERSRLRGGGGQADLVGDVSRGNQRILDIARKAVGFTHKPIDAVISRFGRTPAGALPSRIAKNLRAQAADIGKVNDPLAKAINEVADKIEKAQNYGDLNDIKSHANKMLDSVYSSVPGKAIDATAERAYAYKLAADAIRGDLYPELQRVSGSSLDLIKLGQREADAIALRDGIFEHYYKQVAPEQASKEASGFLEYTLAGQGAPGHSFYSRHIIGRAAEKTGLVPTAGAGMNKQFKRGVGPVGKGIQPEQVVSHTTLQQGASPAHLMAQKMHTGSIPLDHAFPEPAFRSTFGIGPGTPMRTLIASGLAEDAGGGKFRVGPQVLDKLDTKIGTTPYKAGTTPRFPKAGRNVKLGARGARAAQGAAKGLTPPPKPQSQSDSEEEPE